MTIEHFFENAFTAFLACVFVAQIFMFALLGSVVWAIHESDARRLCYREVIRDNRPYGECGKPNAFEKLLQRYVL